MFSRILMLTFSTRFVHPYAASQNNGGFLCRDKIQIATAVFCFFQNITAAVGDRLLYP
jgi:hypothetical protein